MAEALVSLQKIPWRPIEPLAREDQDLNGSLAALEALRMEWESRLLSLDEEDRQRIRQRSLRKLAIETGILERLYDVEWGLTLTLVAEGFTKDVIERTGGVVDERTLATLRSQLDSLEMVLDFVRQDRPLTPGFIKELHAAIVRTQKTYTATDTLGRVVEKELPAGQWKSEPNHVLRQDGTLLEYAPPEQVDSEIDRLVELWSELEGGEAAPIVSAAWLHHRFVQIHPFADGNGRVARALTLLVMEKYRFAPLVVDRWHRADYLKALDFANDGRLGPLVQLFAKLEGAALTGELERPEEVPTEGLAIDVAHTLAAQLAEARKKRQSDVVHQLLPRALAIQGRVEDWCERKAVELRGVFKNQDIRAEVIVDTAGPASNKVHWFRRQISESAHRAGHYADFRAYSSWTNLRIRVEKWQLRYVVSLHGAGKEPGVMAVTTLAEVEPWPRGLDEGAASRDPVPTTKDAFRFVHTESVDDLAKRSPELEELLDEGLAEALAGLLKRT